MGTQPRYKSSRSSTRAGSHSPYGVGAFSGSGCSLAVSRLTLLGIFSHLAFFSFCSFELSQCKGVLRAFFFALSEINTLGNELQLPPAK